ncbi:hypothetical protein SLEP1_g2515 [Rubroshorea leprosula]|uniref:C2 domain-containing protein n=1 Tax=Rubroshorea leprosula TaxID=152421 RepID=A0AAV5HT88_9ROSI|nr:hypothetical protein SLEP1_g2515 [Rubroshorea leprosula]
METKSRTLELTVLSAEDLRVNNKHLKKNAFVVVSIDPFNYRMTKTDAQGGGYPTWNEKVKGPERVYLPAAPPAAAAGMRKFQIDGTENFGGVVTGIPVWSVTR